MDTTLAARLDTAAQDASHTAWLRSEIAKSLADPRPSVAHDDAMARIRQTLATLNDHAQSHD